MLAFGGMAALALLLQHMYFIKILTDTALKLPRDGSLLLDQVDGMLLTMLVGTCLVMLPVTFLVGIVATHRWAGPLYRMTTYLRTVARGEGPGDCKLRKGDELQELCDLINDVTKEKRAAASSGDDESTRRAA